ncbi:MAG: NAD(P)H-hydrate epimerase, partial [Bdellovibrio sp.]
MRVLTSQQLRRLDQLAQEKGRTLESLIKAAGFALVKHLPKDAKFFLFLCGPGNNGSDALVAALELLRQRGNSARVHVWDWSGSKAHLRQTLLQEVKDAGANAMFFSGNLASDIERLQSVLLPGTWVVDGLFGTGPLRPASRELEAFLVAVAHSGCPVLAVDIPSGMDADTGKSWDCTLTAKITVSFAAAKPCFFIARSRALCGQWVVEPLSFERAWIREVSGTHFAVGSNFFRQQSPPLRLWDHKKSRASIRVLAGSPRYPGAGILAARGALRTGLGSVVMVSEFPYKEILKVPEVLIEDIAVCDALRFPADATLTLGSGWDVPLSSWQSKFLESLLFRSDLRIIADAGAFSWVPRQKSLSPNWILTPHSGELARMMGVESEQIEADRWS